MKKQYPVGNIAQKQFFQEAGSMLVTDSVLVPGTVIPAATDISAAPLNVGKGTMLRIRVTAQTYIAFGDDSGAAPMNGAIAVTTNPALELFSAGVYLVRATGAFIRASVNPARIEVISTAD